MEKKQANDMLIALVHKAWASPLLLGLIGVIPKSTPQSRPPSIITILLLFKRVNGNCMHCWRPFYSVDVPLSKASVAAKKGRLNGVAPSTSLVATCG